MANVDITKNVNYIGLAAGEKTDVAAAVTAIRAAYATVAAGTGKKRNVQVILEEVVKGQEET